MAEHLVSLERSSAEISEDRSLMTHTDEDRFPFGVRLHLETSEIEKLGVSGAQVGQEFAILARAKVVSVSKSADEDGENESQTLQITDMAMHPAPTSPDTQADIMFGGNDGG